jgi:DNA adenine methylase
MSNIIFTEEYEYETKNIQSPIIKWVGGKSQIIEEILKNIPNEIENYYEPFIGGGSVLFAILSTPQITIRNKIKASDVNKILINFYNDVKSNCEQLINKINNIVKEYKERDDSEKEKYYYELRSNYNKIGLSIDKSAMFYVLNKTCFRGLYREGPNGFNVPFGNYKNPAIINEDEIRNVSKLIKNVEFVCESFEEGVCEEKFTQNDFIYLDPPYVPEKSTSFVGYTSDGFSLEKHKKLFDRCIELKKDNIRIMMSNSDVELVTNIFDKNLFFIKKILCKRSINSKKPGSKTFEVIVKSY